MTTNFAFHFSNYWLHHKHTSKKPLTGEDLVKEGRFAKDF
jgi:hypothetical protein